MDLGTRRADLRFGRTLTAVIAVSVLTLAGCRSRQEPDELRFDTEFSSAENTESVETFPDQSLSADLEAIHAAESRNESIVARLAAGEPPIAGPIEVATALEADVFVFVNAALTGESQWFPNPTQFGGPRVFRVLDSTTHPSAIQISLPIKPNGQTGWISRDAVDLSSIEHQVLVNLEHDSVTVWDGDKVMTHMPAVTGTAWTPTPTGIFYMRDVIRRNNPDGAYGSHILALSGYSEVLDSFAGGLPAIAIHGTNKPDTMGQERSNGCVRLPNEVIEQLADNLPLGTPVTIVSSTTSPGFGQLSDRVGGRRLF